MIKLNLHVVVFTGAGISASSGLHTFRDNGGLWEQYRIEEVATPEAWQQDANRVTDFYNRRRKQLELVQPNLAHLALVQLERKAQVTVITQNVDDLHERAGSKQVLHLHGTLTHVRCTGLPAHRHFWGYRPVGLSETCPCGQPLRPDVVWFGEEVPAMDQALQLLETADELLVIGTSLQVYPAAQLAYQRMGEIPITLIDPAPLPNVLHHNVEHLMGDAAALLPQWVAEYRGGRV